MTKLIIAGSRSLQERKEEAWPILVRFLFTYKQKHNIIEIVSGTAAGADRFGEQYAEQNNIPLKKMPADWNKYGRSAGPIRNRQMAEYADEAVILWDGKSPGGLNMIETMRELKKPYYVLMVNDNSTLEDFIK